MPTTLVMPAPTAAQLAEVRRMTNEPTTTTYSDDSLTAFITEAPLVDGYGQQPLLIQQGIPPSFYLNPFWIPTYDLNRAAAKVWLEKAAPQATKIDLEVDGISVKKSQLMAFAMKMYRLYWEKKSPRAIKLSPYSGREDRPGYIANGWDFPDGTE